jgi:hypothetical protein
MEIPVSDHLTWHEEQRKRSRIAEQCAAALAEHLPGDWVRCDPHEHVVAIRSGDRRLTVRPERKASVWRLVITAHLPEGYGARTRLEPEETTVAADRAASQIAGQVDRRLLTSAYDAAIAEVHAALAAERDRKDAIAVALAEIDALIPGTGPHEHDGEGYTRFSGPGSWRGSFRVLSSSGEIDIKLDRVPPGLARDIAALIGKYLSADDAGRSRE